MEIKRLKSMCNDASAKEASNKMSWSDFKAPEARKALMIGTVLMILAQLSGVYAMVTYADIIIKEAGTSLSPSSSVIAVSIVQVCGTYVSTVLADRAGRKVSNIISTQN